MSRSGFVASAKVISLIGVCAYFFGCSSGVSGHSPRPDNDSQHPLSAQAAGQPLMSVTLPTSIDPSRRPLKLARGTEVFVVPTIVVGYDQTVGGRTIGMQRTVAGYGLQIFRTPFALLIRDDSGREFRFPPSATILTNVHSRSLGFVAPGSARPNLFEGRRPDYVVP